MIHVEMNESSSYLSFGSKMHAGCCGTSANLCIQWVVLLTLYFHISKYPDKVSFFLTISFLSWGAPIWVLHQMLAKLRAFSEIYGHCTVMIFYEVLFLPLYLCDGEKISSVSKVLCLLWLLSTKSFCESVNWGTCP